MEFNPQRVVVPVVRQIVSRPRLAELMFSRDRWGNVLGEQRYADPFPILERMRADGPVVHRPSYQMWFVTGYDEIRTLIGHRDVSVQGLIDQMMEVRPYTKLHPRTRAFFRSWMLIRDEPDHGRLRRLVSSAFTPKRIAGWEPLVEQTAHDLLGSLEGQSRFDVVPAFNALFPAMVISRMLGIPDSRARWLLDLAADIGLFLNPFDVWKPARVDRAVAELDRFIGELADQRRVAPADDLISALVHAEDADGGGRLSREELVANVGLLAFAGFETTAGSLGNFMLALHRNPEQRRLVIDNPELWPNAVDELFRYDGSSALGQRYTTADIDIGGTTIPKGAGMALLLQAGNRDPRRWVDPNELRLDRPDPSPLSFGHGLHHCLGAHLARLELSIGLREFLSRFEDYRIDESSIEWRQSIAVRGPLTMTVEVAA